ncbi:hypothetical protein CLV52_3326 [Amnibacterium kyonggiense]|uniref:Uncharacterized protein n=1 Tax=Amnibacterium kyonggiense TaxID=595671 RepID=A0A4R7FCZ4_9MICO|nr:hypothetical protein CLV52_3326 [Amnibacterium kyonggiense]
MVWRDECRSRLTSYLTAKGHGYLNEQTAATGRLWFTSDADVEALTNYLVVQASYGARAALWCSHDLGERGGGDSDGGGTHREHEYVQIEFEFLEQRAEKIARNLCVGASAPQQFLRRSDALVYKKAARLQAMHDAAEARVRRVNPEFVKKPSKALSAALEAVDALGKPATQDMVPSPQTGLYAPLHDPEHLRKYNQWRGARSAEKSKAAKEQRRLVLLELPPTGMNYMNAVTWLAENKNVAVSRDQMRRWWRELITEGVVDANDPRKPRHGGAR